MCFHIKSLDNCTRR